MEENLTHLQDWLGKTEEATEVITPGPAVRMAATLDQPEAFLAGDPLRPLWHWIYFTPTTPHSKIGRDGHAELGGFLPPVPDSHRMWAGGRLTFQRPLRLGHEVHKRATVADITLKEGRTGRLIFVLVKHTFADDEGPLLTEEQDLVYRVVTAGRTAQRAPKPAPAEAHWSREIKPDPVLLFRYSALTFNAHRIHYDRKYCLEEEGYPGLVVHGPLTATLLLESLRVQRPEMQVQSFSFRAVSPLFDLNPFVVEGRLDGREATLWALNHQGHLAMQGTALLDY